MIEEKKMNLVEQIEEIHELLKDSDTSKKKVKKIKLPRKAKVKKRKLKQGWVGILKIDENGSITGEKQKVEGACFRSKLGTYHASDGREILFWEGKFPIIVQDATKINPTRFLTEDNETYGQPYIMSKMLQDAIPTKKKMSGNVLFWIIGAIAVIYGLSQVL